MTAARSLQEAFDWTPEPASSRRKPSRLAEHASAWMERAAELGLSEPNVEWTDPPPARERITYRLQGPDTRVLDLRIPFEDDEEGPC